MLTLLWGPTPEWIAAKAHPLYLAFLLWKQIFFQLPLSLLRPWSGAPHEPAEEQRGATPRILPTTSITTTPVTTTDHPSSACHPAAANTSMDPGPAVPRKTVHGLREPADRGRKGRIGDRQGWRGLRR